MATPDEDPVPYDAGEDYDAADHGPTVIPPGTEEALLEEQLAELKKAGF